MLQATLLRHQGDAFGKPIIVANADHRFLIAEQLRAISVEADIILEPIGRNTAPAIALAVALEQQQGGEDALLVLPSDHVIADVSAFHEAILAAETAALNSDHIVTFGITPHKPETGFGYIQLGTPIEGAPGVNALNRFVEKPDFETAQSYLASGDYVWNAGMFLFKVQTAVSAFETHATDVLGQARAALSQGTNDTDFIRPDITAFSEAPDISFDYAIMENINNGAVAPCSIGWSDVGSFEGLLDVLDQDADGNAKIGDVTAERTTGSLLYSTGPAIAATGLDDIALIATPDVVLAVPKQDCQDVKKLVDTFKRAGRPEATQHLGETKT